MHFTFISVFVILLVTTNALIYDINEFDCGIGECDDGADPHDGSLLIPEDESKLLAYVSIGNVANQFPKSWDSMFRSVFRGDNRSIVEDIKNGADVNALNNDGYTVLHVAAAKVVQFTRSCLYPY